MKDVLFITPANRFELTAMLDGVSAVARREQWNLHVIDNIRRPAEIARLVAFWQPIGCLVQCAVGCDPFSSKSLKSVPVVYIDRTPDQRHPDNLVVTHDSAEAGLLAARELLRLDMSAYAYAAYTPQPFWCKARMKSFCDAIRLNRRTCLLSSDEVTFSPRLENQRLEAAARKWLAALPLPIGIFASNDGLADVLIHEAISLGLRIPNDLAIVGVDDTVEVCEKTTPTLSSVHPDYVQAGMLAAELLNQRTKDPALRGKQVFYGNSGVTQRQSTRRLTVCNESLSKALELIRVRASDSSLTVNEIAHLVGVSRRSIELYFRHYLDKGILDELHETRVGIARRLLSDSTLRISEVQTKSGFASATAFTRTFSALVGMSPTSYRKLAVRKG